MNTHLCQLHSENLGGTKLIKHIIFSAAWTEDAIWLTASFQNKIRISNIYRHHKVLLSTIFFIKSTSYQHVIAYADNAKVMKYKRDQMEDAGCDN